MPLAIEQRSLNPYPPMRITLAILLVLSPLAQAKSQSCRPNDSQAMSLVGSLKKLLTTSDPREIADRDSLYHVPAVSQETVVRVSSDSICMAAVAALNALYGETKTRSVYVATLGAGFAVIDPLDDPTGRFVTVVIFDEHWTRIGGFSGP